MKSLSFLEEDHNLEEEEIAKLPPSAKWSKWQKNLRDVCYHIMGTAAHQPSVYASGQMPMYFQNGLLSNFELLEHRHLKAIIASVLLPFVKSCPHNMYPTLLEPVLSHVLTHIVQRFSIVFNAQPQAEKTSWNSLVVGVEEPKRDVVHAKMLLDVVRQVTDFIENTIDGKSVVGADTDTPKHVTNPEDLQLRDFILIQRPALCQLVGALLVQIIGWKDSTSCRRATGLAEKMVNILHVDARFNDLLGREFFTAALRALLYEEEGQAKEDGLKWELINLVRNIYCRLRLGLVPVEECKGFDPCNQPQRPDALLCAAPREILLSLPDVVPQAVEALDAYLRDKHSLKSQKNAFKEFSRFQCWPSSANKRARLRRIRRWHPVCFSADVEVRNTLTIFQRNW
ncbi:hypothetical protein PINS_up024203 [Pythium insidiosum]|nr:hypothetical protein PINS_up024203 [Pythium insidiosum]